MNYSYFESTDNVRLAYREEGDGIPVLGLAGLTRDGRDFDYLLHHLPPCRFIRLDSRGRGGSGWASSETYTVGQEALDVLALLDHLGIERTGIIGSSRGGLIGLVLAATARNRLAGLCLNDVGPKLEHEGLVRIAEYVGVRPTIAKLEDVADRMPQRSQGFNNVNEFRWAEEAVRHFTQEADGVGLPYDPALGKVLRTALTAPLPEIWPMFEACRGLPIALIRGANSDLLSEETVAEMLRRRPDMLYANVPDRGHTPFLDEPEALAIIRTWINDMVAKANGRTTRVED